MQPLARDIAYLNLLDILRAHILRSKFVVTAYATSVTPLQALLLAEIAENPEYSVTGLAADFFLNKSTISRALSALNQEGFLRPQTNKTGLYQLSAKASNFLRLQEKFNYDQIAELSSHVSAKELQQLAHYMGIFAFGDKASQLFAGKKSAQQQIFQVFRQSTKTHGVLNGDYLESGRSATDWVVWSEIYYAQRRSVDIAELLAISNNSMNQILRRYEEASLVRSQAYDEDKRSRKLTLTETGVQQLLAIESCAQKVFDSHLKILNQEQLWDFVDLLRAYVGSSNPLRAMILAQDYLMQRVTSEDELKLLRQELIRAMHSKKLAQYPVGGTLFTKDSLNYAIYKNRELLGGVEVLRSNDNRSAIGNAFVSGRMGNESNCIQKETWEALQNLVPRGIQVSSSELATFLKHSLKQND